MRRTLLVVGVLVALGALGGPALLDGQERASGSRPSTGTYDLYGPGAGVSCGTYTVQAGRSPQSGTPAIAVNDLHAVYQSWVLGFVSGFGAAQDVASRYTGQPIRRMRLTDSAALLVFVENYCREHPVNTLADAAFSLVTELLQNP